MFINCLHIISPQAVSRVTQTTPRHLPDTFQTPYRHHKYGTYFTNPRQLGDKKPANVDQSIGCLSIACTSYPPDSIQSHSDNPQTPLRHFPDNLQTFRERRNQLIKITLIGFMSINITLYPQPILIDLGLSGICRRVSKRCPEGVLMTLDTAWMVIMPNQLLKLQ